MTIPLVTRLGLTPESFLPMQIFVRGGMGGGEVDKVTTIPTCPTYLYLK